MSKFVYLDNAATTSTKKEVVDAMYPFLQRALETHPVYMILPPKTKKR